MILTCGKHGSVYEFIMGPRSGCPGCAAEQDMNERIDMENRLDGIAKTLEMHLKLTTLERDQLKTLLLVNEALRSANEKLTLERDQLREQCAYNQLQLEAMSAKLAKADRMDQ